MSYHELLSQYIKDSMLAHNRQIEQSVTAQLEDLKRNLPWVTDEWIQENVILELGTPEIEVTEQGTLSQQTKYRLRLRDSRKPQV